MRKPREFWIVDATDNSGYQVVESKSSLTTCNSFRVREVLEPEDETHWTHKAVRSFEQSVILSMGAEISNLREALKVARDVIPNCHDHLDHTIEYGNCPACIAITRIQSILGEKKEGGE